jgi:hypothetical protein
MSPEISARLTEFLAPSRIAVVATIGADGMPQLTPNWYVLEDGRIAVSTTKERVKRRNLARDSRMSICVCSDLQASDYVTVSGPVEISGDESIWPVTRNIVARYVPAEAVEDRFRQLRTQNRVILWLSPATVMFRD